LIKPLNFLYSCKTLSLKDNAGWLKVITKLIKTSNRSSLFKINKHSRQGILPEDYYNYAMVLKTNGKYDEANKWMDKFKELKPDDLRAKDYAANKNELTNLLKDNGKYKIKHLNVNTDALDFGTCYYKNKIVFASTRTNLKLFKKNTIGLENHFGICMFLMWMEVN
jgi:tetratricopeptide (TPR) repeat protein